MIHNPDYFADQPKSLSWPTGSPSIDAFSGILSAIGLRGESALRCSAELPFDVSVPANERVLHIAETAGLRVYVDGNPVCVLAAGDMVLMARGTAHRLSGAQPHGEPAGTLHWVSGRFTAERKAADPLPRCCLPPSSFKPLGPDTSGCRSHFSSSWPRS